uniref:Secreted protein n=1 Tax=Knipowitschia caucasica TaxID=637954 RepID=A0AAV2MIW3_KNICA
MCVCHITRWLVVIWLIVSLVHLQANALLQYSAAELLKLRHHVPAPLQPPERGHDIPPGIAFQPRRRYVHRGSRRAPLQVKPASFGSFRCACFDHVYSLIGIRLVYVLQ